MNKTGKNLSDLLDLNRSQILNYLVKHPGCSRAELGAVTGLTLASITKTVRSLIECGVIYETGLSEGKKGRRTIGLSFNYDKYKILAIRLSWCRLELQPFDFMGNSYGDLISISYASVTSMDIDRVIVSALEGIQTFIAQFPEIIAIGMSVLGPYYRDTGRILLPPFHHDPAKRFYYPLYQKISENTDFPVFIEHDADTAALAYWMFTPNIPQNNVIMNILADDGVGIGLVDSGTLFAGTKNSSCEIGHISIDYHGRFCPYCGSHGCMNAYCCKSSLEQIAAEDLAEHPDSILNSVPVITYQTILQAIDKKDPYAVQLMFECGQKLGYGILSLLHVFSPDVVVISGAISLGGDILTKGIYDAFEKNQSSYTTIPRIELLPQDKKIVLLGAAAFAIDCMLNAPTQYFSLTNNK